jgi:hypothetical protein
MNRHDGVGVVVFTAEHLLDLRAFDLLGQRVDRLGEIGGHVLTLLRPIDEHAKVVDLARQLIAQLEIVGQPPAALQGFLRGRGILPEIGSGDSLL